MAELIAQYGLDSLVIIFIVLIVTGYSTWNAVVRIRDRYFPTDRSLSKRVSNLENFMETATNCNKQMMREILRTTHSEMMEQGFISEDELEHIEQTYEAYHQSGGNGTADRWINELRNLPREKDLHKE